MELVRTEFVLDGFDRTLAYDVSGRQTLGEADDKTVHVIVGGLCRFLSSVIAFGTNHD